MSSARVKKFKRKLYYTATWLAGVLSVTTKDSAGVATPHYLVTGDKVDIQSNNSPQEAIKQSVTVTSANTFVVTTPLTDFVLGYVTIDFYRTGQTGLFFQASLRETGANSVLQSFVTGTGTAVYTVSGSLDGVHWSQIATVTHTATDGDTKFTALTDSWAMVGINITSIGAATKLEVLYCN